MPRLRVDRGAASRATARAVEQGISIDTSTDNLEIGKYLVSPLVKQLQDGHYVASVSIRSGRGSATHDRVLRLVPRFDNRQAAVRYATDHALAWIGASQGSPTLS